MGDDGIFRRPAVPQPVRVRRDVNHLPGGDTTLFWYEKAIRRMQSLPLVNPLGWRYQSAIHDYPDSDDPERRADPNAQRGEVLPADRGTYWRQCQHGSWFFLSWHRMYLHFFEKIVARHIVDLSGPPDWALPYWNYSGSSPEAALLPAAFRGNAGDEKTNALFIPQRSRAANQGAPFLRPEIVSLDALKQRPFGQSGSPEDPNRSFGGRMIFNHGFASPGALENVPHNVIHNTIGSGGFMTSPITAALDPIFWLHHSNIDRLWEVWVQRQKQRGNLDRNPKSRPPQTTDSDDRKALNQNAPGWLDLKFPFHDEAGSPATMTTREVLDTRVAPLSYEYEDTSDPVPTSPL